MKFIGIIPARFSSTRFPGKPLVDINGKSMIRRVFEQASKSKILSIVAVATDDERIEKHVKEFGGNVIMTSSNHKTGTDRCFEASQKLNFNLSNEDVIINIQGDEPFIQPDLIDTLTKCFDKKETQIATLILDNKKVPKFNIN